MLNSDDITSFRQLRSAKVKMSRALPFVKKCTLTHCYGGGRLTSSWCCYVCVYMFHVSAHGLRLQNAMANT